MKTPRFIAGFFTALSLAAAAAPAAAITIFPASPVGSLTSSTLSEASGIVGSRSVPGILWVHSDSGDSARFYAINTSGALQGTISLSGASATDWEDIAIGPNGIDNSYVYLGDIGDNNANRSQIVVYRAEEPLSSSTATIDSMHYTKALLQYPGGPRNAESLMVDPWNGDLYIVTKTPSGEVYRAPSTVFGNATPATLSLMGSLHAGLSTPSGADISPDGLHILVRNRSTTAYLFERNVGQSVWDALNGNGIPVTLASETQGEAIGWAADGNGFYTTSERDGQGAQPLYFYAVASDGDFDDNGVIDAADIDCLWHKVRGGVEDPGNNDSEDLNGDGRLNEDDVDYLLAHDLTAGPARRYGDTDLLGGVGPDDFTIWREGGAGWAHGDFDGDGTVGPDDFTLWRTAPATYPAEVGPHAGTAEHAAVPEPPGFQLIASAAAIIWLTARALNRGTDELR